MATYQGESDIQASIDIEAFATFGGEKWPIVGTIVETESRVGSVSDGTSMSGFVIDEVTIL